MVAAFKEFNLKRQFQSKHSDFGRNLNESELHGKAESLKSIMRIATSTISPDFEKLVKTCSQLHSSH